MTVPTAKRVQRYFSVTARWILIVTTVFVLTMVTGLYITNDVLTKVYTASVTLHLPASDVATPAPGSILERAGVRPAFENTMLSPEFLLAIVKELGLEKEWAKRIYKTDQDEVPDVDALTHIEKLVKLSVKRGTSLVEITVASDVPQEAAAIANAMATRYKAARDAELQKGSIVILSRAEAPTEPTKPNKNFDYIVTLVVAGVLSLMVASFVEMVLLFVRAGERVDN